MLLLVTMAVAVSSALPLSASKKLELKTSEGLTDSDMDQLSRPQRNVSLNICAYLSLSATESK